jgi:hypothetical protein
MFVPADTLGPAKARLSLAGGREQRWTMGQVECVQGQSAQAGTPNHRLGHTRRWIRDPSLTVFGDHTIFIGDRVGFGVILHILIV